MFSDAALAVIARALGFVALAVVIGALVLGRWVVPADEPALAAARRGLRRAISIGLAALLLVTAADLLVRTRAMSRAPLSAVIVTLPDVLQHTHFGAVWLFRGAALALAVFASLGRGRTARGVTALLALAVAATTSLVGHAAEWGDQTVSVVVDWAHAVAASAWAGGLLGLSVLVLRWRSTWPPGLLGAVARRFSRLAGLCLLVVVVTGIYNAWAQLSAVSAIWITLYGRILVVKLLAAAVLVALGAANRYLLLPRLGPAQGGGGIGTRLARVSRLVICGGSPLARVAAPSRFAAYLVVEACLGLAIFGLTAVLGEVTPGRHALLQRKLTTHVSAKDLSQSREAERGGSVVPPAGDRERGRAIFARLRCFECHAVGEERFPAPTRPGPDLGTASRHRPGYLLESILNPDAMIVDGPGYAGPDGRSTMPDYRSRLSVGELIDLVAYLKTLGAAGERPTR